MDMKTKLNIGWSNFAKNRHVEGEGNSFFTISPDEVIGRVKDNWDVRTPGTGETELDRKVLIPVNPVGFFISTTALQENLPLKAEVVRRQEGEDLYVETYLDVEDAKKLNIPYTPAQFVDIVCYSKDALLENNGERSGDYDFEIVAVLARASAENHMPPLTMARNYLEKPGGTKSIYTAQEFAEAIYANSQRQIKIRKGAKQGS